MAAVDADAAKVPDQIPEDDRVLVDEARAEQVVAVRVRVRVDVDVDVNVAIFMCELLARVGAAAVLVRMCVVVAAVCVSVVGQISLVGVESDYVLELFADHQRAQILHGQLNWIEFPVKRANKNKRFIKNERGKVSRLWIALG